jgi:hypothetical protein
MEKKRAIESLVAQVLDGTELRLKVDRYTLEENFETGEAKVQCSVHDAQTGAQHTIAGHGVGFIDAFFQGLTQKYAGQFASLDTIRFSQFGVKANLGSGKGKALADSPVEVSLSVANSEGKEFEFSNNSPSITRSSVDVVLQAVEFFINSERAFIQVYNALQHARKTSRPDSVQQYTAQLATLVEATSYSSVIEQIKKAEWGGKPPR